MRQAAKSGTNARVLKVKLQLNWTGPFKTFTVDPTSFDSTPDGRLLAAKLVHLDIADDMPGPLNARCRVSVDQCKPCASQHDTARHSPIPPNRTLFHRPR